MLYVSWPYNLKSPRLTPAIEPLMNALSAWRLPLLFLISGVASGSLIEKLGPGGFARDRLRRLLPVILFGMYLVIPPQTYVVLVSRGVTRMDFAAFWWTQYLRADQTLVRPLHMTMPTWDHIWFLVYLLIYSLLAAGAIALGRRLGVRAGPPTAPFALLLAPPPFLALANLLILTRWPITDALVNDWGAHLKWTGLFATGLLAARSEGFWAFLEARRVLLLALAAALLAVRQLLHEPFWTMVSGPYAWAAICALCGFARAHMNRPSALLANLNDAVLPVYVLHQPLMLVSAFWLFPLGLPLAIEAALLVGAALLGSMALYETVIRPFTLMRILFGLRPRVTTPRPASASAPAPS
jgi:hypothetical protein